MLLKWAANYLTEYTYCIFMHLNVLSFTQPINSDTVLRAPLALCFLVYSLMTLYAWSFDNLSKLSLIDDLQ